MKKILILLSAFNICMIAVAQNIGIGTITPAAKLQINHRTTATSPTLRLFDSTAGTGSSILFAKESQSNTFSIISTNSTFAADNTLDFRTTFNSGFLLRGNGRVGINNVTNPAATLHVGGGVKINDTLNIGSDININGNVKIDNNAGTPGQVLRVNNSGNTSWMDMGDYTNVASFYFTGRDTFWTVPAGVTKFMVEAWGGGGGGTNGDNALGFAIERGDGGGGGGYCKAYYKNVTPGQNVTIYVGAGGNGGDLNAGGDPASASPGDTTEVSYNSKSIFALGGAGATLISTPPGGAGAGSPQTNDFGWFFIQGGAASPRSTRYDQYGSTSFIDIIEFGNGGDAGNTVNTGSSGGRVNKDRVTGSYFGGTFRPPSIAGVPGGGGGGGPLTPGNQAGARSGAPGMVIIYY